MSFFLVISPVDMAQLGIFSELKTKTRYTLWWKQTILIRDARIMCAKKIDLQKIGAALCSFFEKPTKFFLSHEVPPLFVF